MNELVQLMEAGFTERQALAILNVIHSMTTEKVDMTDLLPFHSWLWYKLKQRRELKQKRR